MATTNSLNINVSTPLESNVGGTGVSSPTANGVLIANGASPVSSTVLSNGQLVIGSTGLAPVAAAISAGAGISVVNGAGLITIASTQPVLGGVVDVTGTTQAAAAYTVYLSNNAGAVTFTLPASPAAGDWVEVVGVQGSFVLDSSGTQTIRLGAVVSAAGGTLTSDQPSDSVKVLALTAGTGAAWRVVYAVGSSFDVV